MARFEHASSKTRTQFAIPADRGRRAAGPDVLGRARAAVLCDLVVRPRTGDLAIQRISLGALRADAVRPDHFGDAGFLPSPDPEADLEIVHAARAGRGAARRIAGGLLVFLPARCAEPRGAGALRRAGDAGVAGTRTADRPLFETQGEQRPFSRECAARGHARGYRPARADFHCRADDGNARSPLWSRHCTCTPSAG